LLFDQIEFHFYICPPEVVDGGFPQIYLQLQALDHQIVLPELVCVVTEFQRTGVVNQGIAKFTIWLYMSK
jgi:hypothetical protein